MSILVLLFFRFNVNIYQRLEIFVCVGVDYLTFDILLHAKSEQNMIGD